MIVLLSLRTGSGRSFVLGLTDNASHILRCLRLGKYRLVGHSPVNQRVSRLFTVTTDSTVG